MKQIHLLLEHIAIFFVPNIRYSNPEFTSTWFIYIYIYNIFLASWSLDLCWLLVQTSDQKCVFNLESWLHSLKLKAKAPEKRPGPKRKPDRLPTIHFQMRTNSTQQKYFALRNILRATKESIFSSNHLSKSFVSSKFQACVPSIYVPKPLFLKVNPPKARPFPIKTTVIWALGK